MARREATVQCPLLLLLSALYAQNENSINDNTMAAVAASFIFYSFKNKNNKTTQLMNNKRRRRRMCECNRRSQIISNFFLFIKIIKKNTQLIKGRHLNFYYVLIFVAKFKLFLEK